MSECCSIYYHFCLLSLFEPFVDHSLDCVNIHPREVCLQAAHSILTLARSHTRVFGFRRLPSLVPYYVSAAGLLIHSVGKPGREVSEVATVQSVSLDKGGM